MAPSSRNQSTAAIVPETAAGLPASGLSGKWAMWGVIALAGWFAWIVGSLMAQESQNSVARTAMVVTELQSAAQGLSMDAFRATRGDPGAIDTLREKRQKMTALVSLISTGGRAAPSDPAPVLSLDGKDGFPLPELRSSLAAWDVQMRKLDESAAQIREAASAEEAFSLALEELARVGGNIDRNPRLAAGPWGEALAPARSIYARPEMRTMRVIYSPLRGAEALQSSWAQQFGQVSTQLGELSARAQAASDLSSTDKRLMAELAQASQSLATASATLAQLLPARLGAQGLQQPLREAAAQVEKPLAQIGTRVLAMQSNRPWSIYVSWAGAFLVMVGLAGLVRSAMVLSREQWAASQEIQAGSGVSTQLERLTRQLRRVVTKDGSVMGNGKLDEDPKAATFALASMINRILENHERFQESVHGNADSLTLIHNEATSAGGRLAALVARLLEQANRASALARGGAEELARLSQSRGAQQAHRMVEMTTTTEMAIQEGAFKMDAMRETVQSTSKRLKRLAESAQGIATATDVIDNISRRVKVLSTNAAIEAAAHGENGRKFAVLAKEIERLSQSVHDAAGDIGRIVQLIQSDAQETVAAMELSTSEVVASTDMTVKVGHSVRDIGKTAAELAREFDLVLREIERQAVGAVKLSQQCDGTAQAGVEATQESGQMLDSLEKSKQVIREVKKSATTGVVY